MIEYEGIKYRVFDAHTHWSLLMNRRLRPLLELLCTNEIIDVVYAKWDELKKQKRPEHKIKHKFKADLYPILLNYFGIDKAICLPVFPMDIPFSLECQNINPDRIIGFGGCKPLSDKIDNMLQDLKEKKYIGIKLHAQYNKFNVKLHQNQIQYVLEFLEQNKMIALFHTGTHFDIKDLNPILKKADNVKIILGHMGLDNQTDQALECARINQNVYLETSGNGYQFMIEHAIKDKDIGVHKILYGSDLPTLDPHVEMMKTLSLPISETDKQLILYDNVSKLLSE
jgi:predicted TIM-barrel fold metal-dependent hydrolase